MSKDPKYTKKMKVVVNHNGEDHIGTVATVYQNMNEGEHLYSVRSIEGNLFLVEENLLSTVKPPKTESKTSPGLQIDPDKLTFGRVRFTPHPVVEGAVNMYFIHLMNDQVVGESGPVPFTPKEIVVAMEGFKAAYRSLVPDEEPIT